jgi:hypothetical protein
MINICGHPDRLMAAADSAQLTTAAQNLVGAFHGTGFPQASFTTLVSSVPTRETNPRVFSLGIYYALRCSQEIELLTTSMIFDGIRGTISPIETRPLISKLTTWFKSNPNPQAFSGREFLRFGFDRPLMGDNFPLVTFDKPYGDPSPEFLQIFMPATLADAICQCQNRAQVPAIAANIIRTYPRKTTRLFICDCLRFVFACPRIVPALKEEFIFAFLSVLGGNRPREIESLVGTFEVSICLCLDLFTFQRTNVSTIQTFFAVYRKYPQLLPFIERMAARYPTVRVCIAEAMAASHQQLPISSVELPAVEPQPLASPTDVQGVLNEMIQKLKWQRTPALVSECAGQLLKIVNTPDFDIPVQKTSELAIVLNSKHAGLIAAMCSKSANFLKFAIFDIGPKTPELLQTILTEVFQSEACGTVLPALTKVLVILPGLLRSVRAIVKAIPPNVDVTPLVRFLAHNCTGDEIAQFAEAIVFPRDEEIAVNLFQESLRWKPVVQSGFWIIVRQAAFSGEFSAAVIGGIVRLIRPLTESPIASYHIKFLFRKMTPSAGNEKLFVALAVGSEACASILLAILGSWAAFSEDKAVMFISKNIAAFRTFYEGLSVEKRAQVPAPFQVVLS